MSQFNQYYQDELAYLREMGEEFAHLYPRLAPYLEAEGSDPDVERLLEGFAFLTGRIRQKLDDELPEFTEDMFSLVEPQFLRPLPSTSILQFYPIENAVTERKVIKAGTYVDSRPVDGTPCRFQTSYNVDLQPLRMEAVSYENTGLGSELTLQIKVLSGQATDTLDMEELRIFLHGDLVTSTSLFMWLSHYLESVEVSVNEGVYRQVSTIPVSQVSSPGFEDEQGLYPESGNSHTAHIRLMEYFAFPHKFLFKQIGGLGVLRQLSSANVFKLKFRFNRVFDPQLRPDLDNFKLFCTPIVNIFEWDADPIRFNHEKVENRIRPSGTRSENYEIYALKTVSGWSQGSRDRRDYLPFLTFKQDVKSSSRIAQNFYQLRRKPSTLSKGHDSYIRFMSHDKSFVSGEKEVISLELLCCNRNLPEKLKVGDISVATEDSPEFASFKNITVPTLPYSSPEQGDLYWRLISNISITHDSLSTLESLKQIVNTYNFPAYHSKQAGRDVEVKLNGLREITKKSKIALIKGAPVRGLEFRLTVDSSKYGCEGDMYLFASVLNQFFSLHASINSFVNLCVDDQFKGESYQWKQKAGQIPLL